MESSPSNDGFVSDILKTVKGLRFNNDYLMKMQSWKTSEYKFLQKENLQLQEEVSILIYKNTDLKQNVQKIQEVLLAFVSDALNVPVKDSMRIVEEMLMDEREIVPATRNLPLPRHKTRRVPSKIPLPTIREEVDIRYGTGQSRESRIPISTKYARRSSRMNI